MEQLPPRQTGMDLNGLDYCASHSDSLVSLSYSMVAFSMNSFGLFDIVIVVAFCCGLFICVYIFCMQELVENAYIRLTSLVTVVNLYS